MCGFVARIAARKDSVAEKCDMLFACSIRKCFHLARLVTIKAGHFALFMEGKGPPSKNPDGTTIVG